MIKHTVSTLALISICSMAFAHSCPTQLIREYDGHWVSHQAPGWKSAQRTPPGTSINTKDFGGAVFSPSQKRIACVYRATNGYWVTLISHTHKGFQVNQHQLNDAHNATAWQWNRDHQDFNCGKPAVAKRKNCQFYINS